MSKSIITIIQQKLILEKQNILAYYHCLLLNFGRLVLIFLNCFWSWKICLHLYVHYLFITIRTISARMIFIFNFFKFFYLVEVSNRPLLESNCWLHGKIFILSKSGFLDIYFFQELVICIVMYAFFINILVASNKFGYA